MADINSILRTKFHRPHLTEDLVVRNSLIELLEKNIYKPLSLISAPAGYGKSIIVSQWLEYTSAKYGWISLDEEHNNLRVFLLYLTTAIENIFPGSLTDTKQLLEIGKLPHPWGNATTALSYVLTGVAFPVLMGGSWMDLILSGIFSLVVFFMVLKSGSWGPLKADWLPLSTAFIAGILAAISRYFFPEINLVLVTLSAVLILIPGYGISVGIVEIVTKHIASGLSNLVSGLIYLFKQFFGAWLGVKAVGLILSFPAATIATPVDSVWLWVFMPAIIVALGIAFQTPYRDFFWTCLAMGIAYGGILLGSDLVGSNFGNLLGTIVLVLFTSLWARKTGRPPSIVLVPAFVLLVSGSVGFRGLAAFAAGNMQTGGPEFLQMFVVALTLAAGLVIGVTLIKPERSN